MIVLVVRSRRKKAGGASTPAVRRRSSRSTWRSSSAARHPPSCETDDAVKTSDQELGFAKAQFGDAATVEFEQALADRAARTSTRPSPSSSSSTTRLPTPRSRSGRGTREIIRLCEEANAGLDEKAAGFDELRKLEQNAPEALARVQEQRAQAAASVDAADERLRALAAAYAPEALATVADNPEQARQRIAFADEQLAAAQAAIGAGKGGEAAVGIRAAEEAVGQAQLLEDAIDKLGRDLAEGERSAARSSPSSKQRHRRGIRSSRRRRPGRRGRSPPRASRSTPPGRTWRGRPGARWSPCRVSRRRTARSTASSAACGMPRPRRSALSRWSAS